MWPSSRLIRDSTYRWIRSQRFGTDPHQNSEYDANSETAGSRRMCAAVPRSESLPVAYYRRTIGIGTACGQTERHRHSDVGMFVANRVDHSDTATWTHRSVARHQILT